jgi:hypothetical protein
LQIPAESPCIHIYAYLLLIVLASALMTDVVVTVPEAPSAVKANVMSGDSILVSWKPPEQPNGIVSQYTVYVREDSEEAKAVSIVSDLVLLQFPSHCVIQIFYFICMYRVFR